MKVIHFAYTIIQQFEWIRLKGQLIVNDYNWYCRINYVCQFFSLFRQAWNGLSEKEIYRAHARTMTLVRSKGIIILLLMWLLFLYKSYMLTYRVQYCYNDRYCVLHFRITIDCHASEKTSRWRRQIYSKLYTVNIQTHYNTVPVIHVYL